MIWVLGFALFAFLVNLVREFVKDAEDLEGDRVYGKKTIAVIWGIASGALDFCSTSYYSRFTADNCMVFLYS